MDDPRTTTIDRLDAHIVSHTHWDREWYHPVERFRQRLVALIDELIDDPPGPGESFLLDGQVIVIEDYLAVRPEHAAKLSALLGDGRLEAGPWYVLADELIPSGEALVRNLLVGRRILRRLGATSPPVLYCPDSFGHPAALPAIAAGFRLPLVILWRGYGSTRWPYGDVFRWRAPSGAEAVVYHLSRDGYEFGSHLPDDESAARERWERMRRELAPRSVTDVVLVPNGADHHARQANHRVAVDALEAAARPDHAHRSSLRAFANAVTARVGDRLPVVTGELRDSYGFTWTLQGTFGTRAHEKRQNARAERLLVRDVEPWVALAVRRGADSRALLGEAWRTLLQAHPHDTLCGCSIDEVADAMEQRIQSASNQGCGIRDDAIATLIGHDTARAREQGSVWRPIVVIRNPAARRRSGVAQLEIDEFLAHVPVGPGSAPKRDAPVASLPARVPRVPWLGKLQLLSRSVRHSRTESPRHYPDNDLVAVSRVLAWVDDVPAYGIVAHEIGDGRRRATLAPDSVHVDATGIRNGAVQLLVSDDGRVTLQSADGSREINDVISFVDESDVGDLYTASPRERTSEVRFVGARRVYRGPLRGEIALRFRILDTSRRAKLVASVVVRLSLDAGAPFVRVAIEGENVDVDHRLRLLVRHDVARPVVWADAAFGPVRRTTIVQTEADRAMEVAPPTAPLHRYVTVANESCGCTLISDGLAEYEARDGALCVTLVRGVGELSRNDLPERPGHAGWPTPTPGAQCLGPFAAEFALYLHGPRDNATIDAVERVADDVLLPIEGYTLRSALAVPAAVEGPALQGQGLAFCACKQSEDGDWLVLRCTNLTEDTVRGAWHLPFDPTVATLAGLDECPTENVGTNGRRVEFTAAPRAIVTMLVR